MTTNIFTNPSQPTNLFPNTNAGNTSWQMPNQFPTPNQLPPFNNPFQTQQYDQNYVQNLQAEMEHWKKIALEKDKPNEPQLADIESQLNATQKGRDYLKAKNDGIIGILTKWALQNPMISNEMHKFLDEWKNKANEYLTKVNESKQGTK